ncbi:MAG TPA: CpsD/CapB family tyrosine-protein kinase [Anaerolineae bacterium]|nr:CpsD/CapB family tyrosine-protein kinase [Anaerolineae bacterium]HPL28517.1 CpsD/CapB family tyrosine-protein kinase [Anaerolineae bacterium]
MSGDLKSLVTLSDPNSAASEAYRALRTNLAFAGLDRPLRTVMFTSPGPDEGKSTVLANLAVSLAQTERRVLVVDADLRRPCQHEVFGLANDSGLTTLLSDPSARTRPPIRETGVAGLTVLTSGPLAARPADMVASKRMEEAIAWLAEQADLVLFDSPPINAVADAAVLATRLDGVLLVVRERRTQREAVRQAMASLARVNARVLGAVLSGVSPDRAMARYYEGAPALSRRGSGSEAGAGAGGR